MGHGSWLMCVFVYVKYPTRHDRTTSKASAPHVLQLVDKRKIMVRLAEVYKSPAKALRVYQRTEHRPPVAIHLLHPTDILLVCTYCRPWLFLAVSAMSCPCTAEKRTTMWRLWPGPMMGCLLLGTAMGMWQCSIRRGFDQVCWILKPSWANSSPCVFTCVQW